MFENFVSFVRDFYGTDDYIPLHAPQFHGNEKKYLLEAIDSTFVSSVGEFVNQFELSLADYTGAKHAVATVNGTAALHMSLNLVGVKEGTEVITQSLTFVATCNAIRYCGAKPVFVDIDQTTLGLSPDSLKEFLYENTEIRDDGYCWNKTSNKKIVACLPMHTFGVPVDLYAIKQICDQFNIALVEDAAESLGSSYQGKHTGTIGQISAVSFNGNKIITTGGGGVILTNDDVLAKRAKHITTTAKIPHQWEFDHDEVGYNYRLPNINAALGIAQMEVLPDYLKRKRFLSQCYQDWGKENGLNFFTEPAGTRSNYWLNVVITEDLKSRNKMLEETNSHGVMTRPTWKPMHKLAMNLDCQHGDLLNTEWLYERIVCVPSGVKNK